MLLVTVCTYTVNYQVVGSNIYFHSTTIST